MSTATSHRRPARAALYGCALLAVAASAVGCDGGGRKGKIWIVRYPDFYQPELKSVAVAPFGNRSNARGAGERISDRVSAELTNNRTYEVYTRQHLHGILAEQDLASAGIIDADKAKEIGRLKSVQALICGTLDRYGASSRSETRFNTVPVFGQDANGQVVITGFRQVPYTWVHNEAVVECSVVVIDTATGQQIAAIHEPSSLYSEGSPPKYGGADLLRAAEEDQVRRIVQAIAVTRTQIRLKGDVLKTATSLYDQQWDWQRRIVPGDEKFYVVVTLPPEADRNNFRITIVPKDGREVLGEQEFVWSKADATRGFEFPIAPIVEKHAFGEYRAKLYSGPEPVAWYDFRIVEKR